MNSSPADKKLEVRTTGTGGVAIDFDGVPIVLDLGIGFPIQGQWHWSFDGPLTLEGTKQHLDSDLLGEYQSLALTYADALGPVLEQVIKTYTGESFVVVETTALREISGTGSGDSFFNTTFNSPVLRLAEGLSFLTFTWGLTGGEGTGIAGYFPDVAVANGLDALPEQLRLADFSPDRDVHVSPNKPFAPLIAYDHTERTVVISPLNHYMVSPLRILDTPSGPAVARGLHGLLDVIPSGTTTKTIMAFGDAMVPTTLKWGKLLRLATGSSKDENQDEVQSKGRDSILARKLGFWNCYGGYYAQLFRPTTANTLRQLSDYFRNADIPVGYWGLDLWYQFDRVGFAHSYQPDFVKYPEGLKAVSEETGIPYLLHMSSFDPASNYPNSYEFEVEEGSSYPKGPELYQDLAAQFKEWGATGIWPDFMRTLIQNCRSLRSRLGLSDQWFSHLSQSMAEHGLDIMLCMPTVGHYLASVAYDNVVGVRTSTDFVNHQEGQLELLAYIDEYRTHFSPQRNLKQNLMMSFLAGAVGLAPSHDVFISNREHPEGFSNPYAQRDAISRALSAGIVGLGDKVGHIDQEIVSRLAFSDGSLAQPDHPQYPVVSTLHSDVQAFYTSTRLGEFRWTYLNLYNLSENAADYSFDLGPFVSEEDLLVFDYHAQETVVGPVISGTAESGAGRYLILVPRVSGLRILGFADKYVTMPARQIKAIRETGEGAAIDFDLPTGRIYTVALVGDVPVIASGHGLRVTAAAFRDGLTRVEFIVDDPECRLVLRN
ncbi:MAG: hypothetical protein BZY75_04065 [SAR202 cluster bacterium Io17-Chloro-G7]|nr:MAG: hypothetical protein BZY75_04065 [SAR202 cluster bacterium Io17-Chloro-G7]